jgi:hypothetical protein
MAALFRPSASILGGLEQAADVRVKPGNRESKGIAAMIPEPGWRAYSAGVVAGGVGGVSAGGESAGGVVLDAASLAFRFSTMLTAMIEPS